MCSARSRTGLTVTVVFGLPHHWPDLLGGDRRQDLLDPGQVGGPAGAGGAGDGVGGEVGVQHHLAAWAPAASVCRRGPRTRGQLGAGHLPSAWERRTSSGLGRPEREQLGGAGTDRGVEVERRPGPGRPRRARSRQETWASSTSNRRPSAAACRSGSVGSGSNLALASSTSRISWAGPDLVRHRRDMGVHEPAASRDRHMVASATSRAATPAATGLRAGPSSPGAGRTPRPPGPGPAPGSGDMPRAAAYSATANSATPGHPGPPSGRQDSCQVSTGPTNESSVCIDAHFARRDHHVAGGLVIVPSGPARTPAPRPGRHSHRAAGGRESKSS